MKVLRDNERQKPNFPPFGQQKSAFTLCEPSDKLYICKIPHLPLPPRAWAMCGEWAAAAPRCPMLRRPLTELNAPSPSSPAKRHGSSVPSRALHDKAFANGSTNRTFPSPHLEQAHEVSPNSTMYADCRHEHDRLCCPGFCPCPHACRPRPSRRRQRHQRSRGRCHRSGSFRRDHQSERPKRRLLFRRKRRI